MSTLVPRRDREYTEWVRLLLACAAIVLISACTSHEASPEPTGLERLPLPAVPTPAQLVGQSRLPLEDEFPAPFASRSVEALDCQGDDCSLVAHEAFLKAYRSNDVDGQHAAFLLNRELCIQGEGRGCYDAQRMLGHLTELSENKAAAFWHRKYLRMACEGDVARACEAYGQSRMAHRSDEQREPFFRKAAELYAADCEAGNDDACLRAVGPVPWPHYQPKASPKQRERYWARCEEGQQLACARAGLLTLTDRASLTDTTRQRARQALEGACRSGTTSAACNELVQQLRIDSVPEDSLHARRLQALACHAAPLEGGSSRCWSLAEPCKAGDQEACELKVDQALSWHDPGSSLVSERPTQGR